MTRNISALILQLGKPLVAGCVERLVHNGILDPKPLITYLLFDEWLSIVSTDEQTSIDAESAPLVGTTDDDGGPVFCIEPISAAFPEFDSYIGQRLLAVSELVNPAGSFGIKLYFDNGTSFAVWNEDYPADANHYLFDGQLPTVVKEVLIS